MQLLPIDSLDDLIDAVVVADLRHAQLAVATAELASAGAWAADGWASFNVWLQHHCQLSKIDAHRLLAEGRFLRRYGAVGDAARSGRLSASQVSAIRRAVPPVLADLFDDHQQVVVDAVADLDVAGTTTVCQDWRARAEALIDAPDRGIQDRSWKSSKLDDGTMVGQFVFDPTSADELSKALEIARTFDGEMDTRTYGQTMADAVATIAAFFNANHTSDVTPRNRNHVEMPIDVHAVLHPDCDGSNCESHATSADPAKLFVLAFGSGSCVTTMDGVLLPEWASDAYTCDCVMHRVLRSGSAVLDYGVAERTAPKDLFRAVAARDRGCRFPGCDRKVAFCEAHHIIHWRKSGSTSLDNLLLLCSYHHHFVHRERWSIRLYPDARVDFTTPDGRSFTSRPRAKPNIRIPIAA